MPYLVKISLIGFLFLSLVFCNEKSKTKKELAKLDFYLDKGFISDTLLYESMFFKMRIVNRNDHRVHLFFEKWFIPFSTDNVQPQKKSGSIFMLDSARNKLNELLLWPLFPNETTINPKKQVELLLKGSIKGLVNPDKGARPDIARLQRELFDRLKNSPYYYYNVNDKGVIEDSFAIQLDKKFFIAYREPLAED
jgi:hypothetical protein